MSDGPPAPDGSRRLEGRAPRGARVDVVLAEVFEELTRARAAALVRGGAVQVDGRPVTKASARVGAEARLVVDLPPPAPSRALPQDLPVRLVFQDDALVVVDKVPGMVVHPGPGHPDGTLVNALLHHVGGLSGIGGVERPGIVHRLDRGTSGLLVVAKTERAHHHLAAQFAALTAGRVYLALCLGAPAREDGTYRSHLARHPRDRVRFASTDGSYGKVAVTHWRVCSRTGEASLIECRLETGRTHQVRVHLSEHGWPLLGDDVYRRRGRRPPDVLRPHATRPMLHAWKLSFAHPDGDRPMEFEAPPPADLLAAIEAAGLVLPSA